MKTLEPILAEHPFFKGLDARCTELLVGCASNVVFKPGEYLFREGSQADSFFVIRHGDVAVETYVPGRGALTVQTVHEGEMLGWSWLIPPYRCTASARAATLTRAVALDGGCLRKKCEENHDLGYELLKRVSMVIADRLQETRLLLIDLYAADGRQAAK